MSFFLYQRDTSYLACQRSLGLLLRFLFGLPRNQDDFITRRLFFLLYEPVIRLFIGTTAIWTRAVCLDEGIQTPQTNLRMKCTYYACLEIARTGENAEIGFVHLAITQRTENFASVRVF